MSTLSVLLASLAGLTLAPAAELPSEDVLTQSRVMNFASEQLLTDEGVEALRQRSLTLLAVCAVSLGTFIRASAAKPASVCKLPMSKGLSSLRFRSPKPAKLQDANTRKARLNPIRRPIRSPWIFEQQPFMLTRLFPWPPPLLEGGGLFFLAASSGFMARHAFLQDRAACKLAQVSQPRSKTRAKRHLSRFVRPGWIRTAARVVRL
jgi:hypothetical protein